MIETAWQEGLESLKGHHEITSTTLNIFSSTIAEADTTSNQTIGQIPSEESEDQRKEIEETTSSERDGEVIKGMGDEKHKETGANDEAVSEMTHEEQEKSKEIADGTKLCTYELDGKTLSFDKEQEQVQVQEGKEQEGTEIKEKEEEFK